MVVLPFETPDFPRNTAITPATITQEFFGASGNTIAGFYAEASWGQFTLKNGGVSDWVTLTKNLTAYLGFEGDDQVPRDVLKKANINWAALDTDNDKTITPAEAQLVFLVADGYSVATRGFTSYPTGNINNPVPLGSLANIATPNGTFSFLPSVVYVGTKTANDPNFASNPFRVTSSINHELGHAFFNLPDRYLNFCATGRTGAYDIMANNCSFEHFTLYDKMKFGWIQPPILRTHLDQCVAFPASEATKAGLVLVPPAASPSPGGQYWVIENRNPADSAGSYDSGLPESGLAIWWINTGAAGGFDDIRLVDASKPDMDPDGSTPFNGANPGYINQGVGALFKEDQNDSRRLLIDSAGGWSVLYFQQVSNPGSTIFANF